MITNKEIKRLCEEIEIDNTKIFQLIDYFTKNATFPELVELLTYTTLELHRLKKENKQIPISKEDYLKIRNLFKIRGYKILPNGTVVEENRGGNRYTDLHDSH